MIETQGGFLISQIKHIQGRIFEQLLHQAGLDDLNGAQGRILYVLWQKDNVSIRELSKATGLAKTTLTSMLERMEEQDFLKRIPSSTDRRQTNICLSEKSKQMNQQYNQVSNQMSEIFYEGFEIEEIVQFENQLKRILLNLQNEEYEK